MQFGSLMADDNYPFLLHHFITLKVLDSLQQSYTDNAMFDPEISRLFINIYWENTKNMEMQRAQLMSAMAALQVLISRNVKMRGESADVYHMMFCSCCHINNIWAESPFCAKQPAAYTL